MAATSLQDQVSTLLSRQVAEDRNHGRRSVDLEAAALIQNYATTLLLNPKVVLYFAYLARNGLLKAVQDEIDALTVLTKTINDLGNTTFTIKSTVALERAKNALLQLEDQNISSVGPAYDRYTQSVTEFLNKQLAKNVRVSGATELSRPAGEARTDLPSDYSALASFHSDTLSRLFALVVGVQNFQSTPLNTLIGSALAYQAREDIQGIIDDIEVESSGSQSRDYVNRLIGSRAAVKSVTNPPGMSDPVLSPTLPAGYRLTASSELLPATTTFGPAPFTGRVGDLTISVDGIATTFTPNLGDGPTLVGAPVVWPISVPANTHLFFSVGGSTVRVPLNTLHVDAPMHLANVVAAIDGAGGGLQAAEFVHRGATDRLVVWAPAASSLGVLGAAVVPRPGVIVGVPSTYIRSAHTLVGLSIGTGSVGVPTDQVVDFINNRFPAVRAAATPGGTVTLSSVTPTFGTTMIVSGVLATAWGAAGTFSPASAVLTLSGTTPDGTPSQPSSLLSPGDRLSCSSGTALIQSLTQSSITLATPLKTFTGPITVTSGLLQSWQALDQGLLTFLDEWRSGPFLQGLGRLSSYIAVLAGSATPAQRSDAITLINSLASWLADLVSALTGSVQLPVGGAALERPIAEDLIFTLLERKYDRAADLLTQCQVAEFFGLDYQTVSYGGALMRAGSELAASDLAFPNRSKDEGMMVTSSNSGNGEPP